MLNACGEYRSRLVELARGHAGPDDAIHAAEHTNRRLLLAHAERCADCARALDEQMALSAALGTLADGALPEIAEIEARVLAEFDRRARWSWRRRVPVAALLAAAAAIGFLWVNRRTPVVRMAVATPPVIAAQAAPPEPRAPIRKVGVRPVHKAAPIASAEEPFLPIPYTVPPAPEERTSVVRMEVPVAALIAAGYRVETSDPGGVLDADVLVSQDGRARAIRLNTK
jgi:hypothetical protein